MKRTGVLFYDQRRVFPGGCFFVAAGSEVGTYPGPVRDLIAAQLAFELHALLAAANNAFILQGDAGAFDRARTAIRDRLRPR